MVRLFGIYAAEQQTYMVLEFAENGSLDRHVTWFKFFCLTVKRGADNFNSFLQSHKHKKSDLSDLDLILMCHDIVKGLMYIQSKNIIHRYDIIDIT